MPDLVATLRRVLIRANFVEVTAEELARAAEEQALFQVEVRAATDEYRDVHFFRRGRHRERIERREWMGLRVRHFDVDVYDDVVMVATLRPEQPAAGTRLGRFRPRRRHRPGSMLIKCFRDIPSADLNTLLPDVKVIMGQRDKWMIGVPALVGGIPLLLKLGPTLAVLAILIGIRLGTSGEVAGDRIEQALIVTERPSRPRRLRHAPVGQVPAPGAPLSARDQRQPLFPQRQQQCRDVRRHHRRRGGTGVQGGGARLFLPARRARRPGGTRPEDRGMAQGAIRRRGRFRARRRPREAGAAGAACAYGRRPVGPAAVRGAPPARPDVGRILRLRRIESGAGRGRASNARENRRPPAAALAAWASTKSRSMRSACHSSSSGLS